MVADRFGDHPGHQLEEGVPLQMPTGANSITKRLKEQWERGDKPTSPHDRPVAPVAYQVCILEAGIGQFHEFESPRVQTVIECQYSWQ